MKRLLIAAAALVALTSAANAVELPRIYLGTWCGPNLENSLMGKTGDESGMYTKDRENCAPNDGAFVLGKTGFNFGVESIPCQIKSVRRTGQSWPISTKPRNGEWPKGDWIPAVDITARCDRQTVVIRVEWHKGGFLGLTDLGR
jgi:hypothetical protein